MKPIYINEANADQINEAIRAAEGKATQRTLDYGDLCRLLSLAEQNPALALLPKKHRRGVKLFLQVGDKLPANYKWRAEATAVTVEFGPKGWRLVSAERVRNHDSISDRIDVMLPAEAAAEAERRFRYQFTAI